MHRNLSNNDLLKTNWENISFNFKSIVKYFENYYPQVDIFYDRTIELFLFFNIIFIILIFQLIFRIPQWNSYLYTINKMYDKIAP